MVTIITGTTNKPVASEALKVFFQANDALDGYLYIGYPIIGTVDGAYPIDGLWISPSKGLVVFNLIEGKNIDGYQDAQDDCANKVEAKLKGYKQLMKKRTLCVHINVITFAPALVRCPNVDEDYPLCINNNSLFTYIDDLDWEDSGYYEALVSVLQAISTIRKGKKKREIVNPQSRGAKLRALEDSIANLDNRQSRAVIETVEGVQRIRGLAGSGKTIVIALKAAYLHAQHPDWRIAITFNTRSLKGQLRQLINTFYIEQTSEEPDWDNVQIIHAWGAPGGGERNGLYYTFCSCNNVEYSDFMTARNKFGSADPFGKACAKALEDAAEVKQLYDAILVDEAQDFSPSFLRMCYEMLKKPKRLVYAYDELQNLRSQSLPSPEEIFGKHEDGSPKVKFEPYEEGKPQQDIILEKCYRNSRPALVTAHALGFGIYREPTGERDSGLVQMFDQRTLWEDIGYEVTSGELEDGKHVVLQRTAESSPTFLETHSDIDDLIVFKSFETQEEQDAWVAREIKHNLEHDELRPDDIIVINPDPITTKRIVAPIRSQLYQFGIASHTAGVDTAPDIFFADNNDSVAFTGIYRAKGNEAAMVYIVNAQACFNSYFDLAKIRNQLFTAITRSKAWVRVLGIGSEMQKLISEYEKVKQHGFTLDFEYPTKAQRDHMNIVNRDMSAAEKDHVRKSKSNVASLIDGLESGQIYLEDLGEEQVLRLRALLEQKEE
ncbi:MAG: DEAD/DEAH box helicase [Oscillibacter sp.]|nr:DEAD/DEAH box helicase [Oscillibacter sp.]